MDRSDHQSLPQSLVCVDGGVCMSVVSLTHIELIQTYNFKSLKLVNSYIILEERKNWYGR